MLLILTSVAVQTTSGFQCLLLYHTIYRTFDILRYIVITLLHEFLTGCKLSLRQSSVGVQFGLYNYFAYVCVSLRPSDRRPLILCSAQCSVVTLQLFLLNDYFYIDMSSVV